MSGIAHCVLFLFFALSAVVAPAHAQQQKWAAAYVDWAFPDAATGVEIAQDIWAPQAARASFFTLNFDFTTGQGGYIGLQSDESGAGNARFSLWNTSTARGNACRPFDGEGEGMTCATPMTIDAKKLYRVRVVRGEVDVEGQWWMGYVLEADGAAREIGAIRTPHRHRAIASAGLHNFSEYWGNALTACRETPLSVAAFAAPILKDENGAAVTGVEPNGTRPKENRCVNGRERIGAAVTHAPLTLRGASAMLLALGGGPDENRALALRLSVEGPER
jgi:hypothetical protein